MFDEKIKALTETIATLETSITTKTAEIKAALGVDDLETAKDLKAEVEASKAELEQKKTDLSLFEDARKTGGAENAGGKEVKNETAEMTYRDKVNAFIRSKGMVVNEGLNLAGRDEVLIPMNAVTPVEPSTDGVKKKDATKVTSEEILYTPTREVKTVVDLKPFTNIHTTTKASGKYPVLKQATATMISVEELEKNPKLARPEFENVEWAVTTYRGAIPVSQESIDDADVDLVAIVAENIGQIKVNTTNKAIASVLKGFAAKTVTSLDDLKHILNVDLDPAYDVSFVVSQSFYQILDTLKDGNGRYLLQDSIVSASGKVFSGKPVFVLADTVLGEAGEAKAFVGDFKRGVLFADRKDLGLRWADNEIYGQYLQAVMRFGVKQIDAKAGYFVTYTP